MKVVAALAALLTLALWGRAQGFTNGAPEIGFTRIIRGWTNYSTAFNATHDTGAAGDFATVGSFYTPEDRVVPIEYGVIVIWDGSRSQHLDFAAFSFRLGIWSSLGAFAADPRVGDVATWTF